MAEKLFVQGDINVTMLDGAADFVPFKSDDAAEVEMFQASPAGVVALVRQAEGQQVGQILVEDVNAIEDPAAHIHVAKFVAVSELGAAWHLSAQKAPDIFDDPVDRRVVRYAYLATGDPEVAPTTEHVNDRASIAMLDGVTATQLLLGAFMRSPGRYERQAKQTARILGNASMWLAVMAHPKGLEAYGPEVTDANAQYFAKRCGQWVKEAIAKFALDTGTNPSIAQFAPNNRDSELARRFRTEAPSKEVRELYDAAIAHKTMGIRQFFPVLN